MNKTIAALWLIGAGLTPVANALTLAPVTDQGEEQSASISYIIKNELGRTSNAFLSDEAISLSFTIKVKPEDVEKSGGLYLLAFYDDKWVQRGANGEWTDFEPGKTPLKPFAEKSLSKEEVVEVLNQHEILPGEALVFSGYKAADSEQLYYNRHPASLVVFDPQSSGLHKVKNTSLLNGYFAMGSTSANYRTIGFPIVDSTNFDDAASGAAETNDVSQTNLQESGVDEGDRIKTDGEHLYTLENCDETDEKQGVSADLIQPAPSGNQCITAYAIQADPAESRQLDQLNTGLNQWQNASLYLATINERKNLLHLSHSYQGDIWRSWIYPYSFRDNQTDLKFVDVSEPENMTQGMHVSLDATLLSSRVVNGVLYVVTRKNPQYIYPEPIRPVENRVATLLPAPETDDEIKIIDYFPQPPEQQDIEDLLPTISFNDDSEPQALVDPKDCFLPGQSSEVPFDNSLMTITAIPLDNPRQYYSQCIAGYVDTFYMSTSAVYFATSRSNYSFDENGLVYDFGSREMTTEIHKFALADGTMEYRGSGSVPGHLGWAVDKKPFRMGENNGVLKVATSKGDSWNQTATTRVGVLRESADNSGLEEVSFLDNLGKPGEQLFAARFIGDKGFLVTFQKTDPLFVIDFADPEQPEIIGELEIDGYSDYLHPIGNDYLLGIGKDAVASDQGDFAWYLGVKLSLFDISSAENLREVESLVIGKRGTESAVLHDHHALAWLSDGDKARLAIPVQLHEQEIPDNGKDYSQPQAYYDWTHTGLYNFEIDTGDNPGIQLTGRLIVDAPADYCALPDVYCRNGDRQSTYNDRVVIQGDSVHYLHNSEVYSSAIADLE